MNIRFTSSLTPEDENRIAPALLSALAGILDMMPIAYAVRIDTSDAQVYQYTRPLAETVPTPAQANGRPALVVPIR